MGLEFIDISKDTGRHENEHYPANPFVVESKCSPLNKTPELVERFPNEKTAISVGKERTSQGYFVCVFKEIGFSQKTVD